MASVEMQNAVASASLRMASTTVAPQVAPACSIQRHIVPRSIGTPRRAKRSSWRCSGRPSQYLSTTVRDQRDGGDRPRKDLRRHRRGDDLVFSGARSAASGLRYFTRETTSRRAPPRCHAILLDSSEAPSRSALPWATSGSVSGLGISMRSSSISFGADLGDPWSGPGSGLAVGTVAVAPMPMVPASLSSSASFCSNSSSSCSVSTRSALAIKVAAHELDVEPQAIVGSAQLVALADQIGDPGVPVGGADSSRAMPRGSVGGGRARRGIRARRSVSD